MRIDRVVVAVPARDEAPRIRHTLAAIEAAGSHCGVPVDVVVAADACTDATAQLARTAGAQVVECSAGRVGAARAVAVQAGLAGVADPERVWIANTDADSVVPPEWLTVHLEFAEQGVGLLRGAVTPDPRELTLDHFLRWLSLNPHRESHDYVHGANLGLTGGAYLAVGGFSDVPLQEDLALVRAVEATGRATASTARGLVVTSARSHGRLDGGFAAYLREHVFGAASEVEL